SSPFHRDDLLEKLRYPVDYGRLFSEAFKAEGTAGLDKVLDRYAQDVRKDAKYLAFYKRYDELLSNPGDDVVEGYNCPRLGFKLKKIVADAYLNELRTNPDLVPMSIKDFREMILAIPNAKDAAYAESVATVWFAVAFANKFRINLSYRQDAGILETSLSKFDEEKGNAFAERALEFFKSNEFGDDSSAMRFALEGFKRKIRKAIDAKDSEGLEKIVADLVEWEKEYDPASLVYGAFRYDLLRVLEVARPDLAFLAYDEVAKRSRDPKRADCRFEMETAAFYCESISAILAADHPELEKLADKLAENALDPTTVKIGDNDGVIREADYLYFQKRTFANAFHLHFKGKAREILDRTIRELEKSDKPNAKSFRELLIDVQNDPSVT
ncbi:MAG: hypothetical protein IKX88_09375, partial [Thermoguttaceae bacterium]|nr:hypothetical protein [Thermoguttaceae bacterium]